jgi:hypothetical protein
MLPPPVVPEADALRRAAEHLAVAVHPNGEADALREAVCAYVRALRDRNVAVETTLIAVRTIVHVAMTGLENTGPLAPGDQSIAATAVSRSVSQCIAEYYRPA